MSLINDALKRAKEAQDQAPAPTSPGPQLRPVEEGPSGKLGLFTPITIAVLGIGVVVLGWQLLRSRVTGNAKTSGATELMAQTKTPSAPATPVSAPEPTPAPERPTAPASTAAPKAVEPASPQVATPEQPAATPAPNWQSVQTSPEEAIDPAPAKPAEPAPLRLQGIMNHPTRPSALISGKTLFVGDSLRGMKLKAIRGSSVTMTGPEGTIVLTLR